MSQFVEDGFKIVNVDNGKLETLRRNSNNLDTGALKILESLDLFCEDLADSCDYATQVSYQKLFNSLRTVIKCAYENEKIRNAVMTGIIQDTPDAGIKRQPTEVTEKTNGVRQKELNENEVREFSRTHTLSESAEYFGVTKEQIKNYVIWHNIEYVNDKSGRKGSLDKEKVLKVSSELTIKELAALFNVKVGTMGKFCERNNIPHKRRNTNV